MFDTPLNLGLGLLTGIVFGFLLQKGRAAKYHVIMGQFLLNDWTVVKIMATAVIVGAVGVYALTATGVASLHIKPMLVGGVVIGAALFGIGIAVFGYCPGTSVAACAEGRRDAMFGVLGMLFGAAVFVALHPTLKPLIQGLGDMGEITLPEVFNISTWVVIGALIVVGGLAIVLFESIARRGWGRILSHGKLKRTTR
jgi:uncharacterized protein